MSNFKLFRHEMLYSIPYLRSAIRDHPHSVYCIPFNDMGDKISFSKQSEPNKVIMDKKDGEYIESNFNGWPCTYSLVDIDNPDNYLYYYEGDTGKLKYPCLILRKYYIKDKIYYITKRDTIPKNTLCIFDYDLEGGKYIKRGKPVYYTIGNNKPGVLHDKEKYYAYIRNEQAIINQSIKDFKEKKEVTLKTLDSFLIEAGGLFSYNKEGGKGNGIN